MEVLLLSLEHKEKKERTYNVGKERRGVEECSEDPTFPSQIKKPILWF
jgi:hypothetical protein